MMSRGKLFEILNRVKAEQEANSDRESIVSSNSVRYIWRFFLMQLQWNLNETDQLIP